MEIPKEFIENNNNKILFASRIYYKYSTSFKNNKLNYVDYMCKVHRKEETKHKDKKLCYGKIRQNFSNDDEMFYFVILHSEHCNNFNKTIANQSLIRILEDNIDNKKEFNDFISSLIINNNKEENHNGNFKSNNFDNNNTQEIKNYNSNSDSKKEDTKFIQEKLKEFCILTKLVSLKKCRDFINMNYNEYKSYTINDPNIIKNIY